MDGDLGFDDQFGGVIRCFAVVPLCGRSIGIGIEEFARQVVVGGIGAGSVQDPFSAAGGELRHQADIRVRCQEGIGGGGAVDEIGGRHPVPEPVVPVTDAGNGVFVVLHASVGDESFRPEDMAVGQGGIAAFGSEDIRPVAIDHLGLLGNIDKIQLLDGEGGRLESRRCEPTRDLLDFYAGDQSAKTDVDVVLSLGEHALAASCHEQAGRKGAGGNGILVESADGGQEFFLGGDGLRQGGRRRHGIVVPRVGNHINVLFAGGRVERYLGVVVLFAQNLGVFRLLVGFQHPVGDRTGLCVKDIHFNGVEPVFVVPGGDVGFGDRCSLDGNRDPCRLAGCFVLAGFRSGREVFLAGRKREDGCKCGKEQKTLFHFLCV